MTKKLSTFKTYLNVVEAREEEFVPARAAVITFGRFNPPTRGHQKVIRKVMEVAKEKRATPFVFVSQTQDKNKNPLDFETKVAFMKALMPEEAQAIVGERVVKTAWEAIEWLDEQGYTQVYMIVGSDRVGEFNQRWLSYAEDAFDEAEVISAGDRDPDNDGSVEAMSGTKARQAAMANDLGAFRAATGWDGDLSVKLMMRLQNSGAR